MWKLRLHDLGVVAGGKAFRSNSSVHCSYIVEKFAGTIQLYCSQDKQSVVKILEEGFRNSSSLGKTCSYKSASQGHLLEDQTAGKLPAVR